MCISIVIRLGTQSFKFMYTFYTPLIICVSLGSDLIIPCYLSPEISAVDLEISWSNDRALVCLYKDRQVTEGVFYKDRASLATCVLERGNVSLNLSNFSVSDVGDYYCQVINQNGLGQSLKTHPSCSDKPNPF
uniref:Ig-like domain-containing protein n=1 Tax=Cyprinus carpio TaxID=7962 RepID=A0A8C1S048_CYPCA